MKPTKHHHAGLDYWTERLDDDRVAVVVEGHGTVAHIQRFTISRDERFQWRLVKWPQRRATDELQKDAAYWAAWAWYCRSYCYDPDALKRVRFSSLLARRRFIAA